MLSVKILLSKKALQNNNNNNNKQQQQKHVYNERGEIRRQETYLLCFSYISFIYQNNQYITINNGLNDFRLNLHF